MASNASNWFLDFFQGSARSRELREMTDLYARVRKARDDSPLGSSDKRAKFLLDLIHEICERRGVTPSVPLGEALWSAITSLLHLEGFLVELPEDLSFERLTMAEGVELRQTLNRHLRFIGDQQRLLTIWRDKLVYLFFGMLEYFPLSAFTDIDEQGVAMDDSVVLPEARAYALCDNLPEVIDRLLATFYDQDVINANLFQTLRERFDLNALRASGISPEKMREAGGKAKWPSEQKNKSAEFLIDAYLQATPFVRFFYSPLPFAIPFPARFEHTHIVGGTGHGKTQLMQFLINHDLVRALEDNRSVVVMDSQGDLIRTISHLSCFSPTEHRSLADRFVLVDPNDVEHPVCLNMFDFNRDRLSGYAPVDREKILNATIELYEYFFGALLGAELTQRQGLIFKYLARLLIEIPDATIHTLRELMEDSERFRPYMAKLTGTARSFFETRFFDRQFNETKKQILTRLWGVLSNASLERMFSHPRNKIDIFELMNEGKIILINTAKDLLGQEGSAIFGRFFIALIAQAAIQRAAIPAYKRQPSFVYIDEAQDYFDENISHLLNQARKYRVGLIFAHQNLDQLGAGLRSSVLASTTIKFAGGLSAKDANALDSEFRCDSAFLLSQTKQKNHTEFACLVKNYTGRALSVTIPLGFVEGQPQLDTDEYDALLQENRALYSAPPVLPDDKPFPSSSPSKAERAPRETFRPTSPVRDEPAPPPAGVPPFRQPETSSTHTPDPMPIAQSESTLDTRQTERKGPRVVKEATQPGRGGRQHKYLQHLVKQLAEDRGFRASIEETILDGAGRVDVSLQRNALRVACQISVTTTKDWELGGIEKCLAAGYTEVVLIGSNERHIKALSKFIEENLEENDQGKVRYVTSETLVEYLDGLGKPAPSEQVVRGYKVRTVQQSVDPEDAKARRKAITEVIARSLKKSRDE